MLLKPATYSLVTRNLLISAGKLLLLTLVFGVIYTQSPLYSSNQNQYFLQGLAKAGYGFLQNDWMANTVDPVPAFNMVVYFTVRFLHQGFFYGYWFLLLGVYIYSICGIASLVFNINKSRIEFLLFLALVFAFHSPLVDYIGSNWLGTTQQYLLNRGVASQYLLGDVFQPSLFGVFFVLSICLFLQKKLAGAVLALALAATFHTSSILSAAILTLSYMVVTFKEERNIKKPFWIGFSALILVVPIVAYVLANFRPDAGETWRQAQNILADFRDPHHVLSKRSELGEWFYFRVAVVIAAIYLVRKSRLFGIMAITFSIAAILSAIQILTDSNKLGMMFPWRFSTVLVPLSLSLITAFFVSFIFDKFEFRKPLQSKLIDGFSIVAILFLIFWGIREMKLRYEAHYHNPDVPMMEFVKETKQPGDTYLIPALDLEELENFRLFTGAPVFIDYKSVPYNTNDVLEWYQRVIKMRQFYEAAEMDCQFLKQLDSEYNLTHIVVENRRFPTRCEVLEVQYRDNVYGVYRINRPLVKATPR